jgi:hypothetical protein
MALRKKSSCSLRTGKLFIISLINSLFVVFVFNSPTIVCTEEEEEEEEIRWEKSKDVRWSEYPNGIEGVKHIKEISNGDFACSKFCELREKQEEEKLALTFR